MEKRKVNIIKSSGERVEFSKQKLHDSLKRSGADEDTINQVISEVEPQLFEGINTKKIFRMAFNLLKKREKPLAAKYKLKEAIMELGPTGYPFEKYISEILKYQGFKTTVGQIVQGSCVKHEIDVIAEKDEKHFMIECKYHNTRGIICNVKIPLYIQARFKDIEINWKNLPGHAEKVHQGWVVTNTTFSEDAIQYGTCVGLNLIGWNFPKNGSLKEQIDDSGLYPITCLTTISTIEKQRLLDNNIVLAIEILKDPKLLFSIGISQSRSELILNETQSLCKKNSTLNSSN
jgi:ATP cone domain/Restriction endonuclease